MRTVTPMRAIGCGAVAIILLAALVSGCSSRPDTRYLESHELAPLRVPAGLDSPAMSASMEIPAPARGADGDEPVPDIEIPPRRIGGP